VFFAQIGRKTMYSSERVDRIGYYGFTEVDWVFYEKLKIEVFREYHDTLSTSVSLNNRGFIYKIILYY